MSNLACGPSAAADGNLVDYLVDYAGSLECSKALLEAEVDISRLCEGSPALHMAVSVGSLLHQQAFSAAAVQLLLQHGAVPYERYFHTAMLLLVADLLPSRSSSDSIRASMLQLTSSANICTTCHCCHKIQFASW